MNTYKHEVKYYECDRMGVTHHSNYVRFMEEARVDWLDQLGFGFEKIAQQLPCHPCVGLWVAWDLWLRHARVHLAMQRPKSSPRMALYHPIQARRDDGATG